MHLCAREENIHVSVSEKIAVGQHDRPWFVQRMKQAEQRRRGVYITIVRPVKELGWAKVRTLESPNLCLAWYPPLLLNAIGEVLPRIPLAAIVGPFASSTMSIGVSLRINIPPGIACILLAYMAVPL